MRAGGPQKSGPKVVPRDAGRGAFEHFFLDVFDEIGRKNGDDFWISGLARPGPKVGQAFFIAGCAEGEPPGRCLSAVSRRLAGKREGRSSPGAIVRAEFRP